MNAWTPSSIPSVKTLAETTAANQRLEPSIRCALKILQRPLGFCSAHLSIFRLGSVDAPLSHSWSAKHYCGCKLGYVYGANEARGGGLPSGVYGPSGAGMPGTASAGTGAPAGTWIPMMARS